MVNRPRIIVATAAAALLAGAVSVFAQGLLMTQPKLLQIDREQVETGYAAAHAKTESGGPAVFGKANSPDYYLAMVSMTGPQVAWFVSPWDSYNACGRSTARDAANAEHIDALSTLEATARPDLSHGVYPDLNKQRFREISIMRPVRRDVRREHGWREDRDL